MKKVTSILILALVLTLFSACAHMFQSPMIPRIQQRGELIVGTAGSMPPMNMTTRDGRIIGLEPDLAKYIADSMGVKLRLEIMPFSELLPALEAGKVDMILSNMTIMPERNLKVAFVGPYFVSGKAFLTKIERIASAEDTSEVDRPDVTLTTLNGSTSQYFVEDLIPRAKLVTAEDYDKAVAMVLRGEADAMMADYPICVVSVYRYPDAGLISLITPLTYEPIGIALPANDAHMINFLENFLFSLEGSGGLEDLKKKWFEEGSWLEELP